MSRFTDFLKKRLGTKAQQPISAQPMVKPMPMVKPIELHTLKPGNIATPSSGLIIDKTPEAEDGETKWKTVLGELIDLIQFILMATFDEIGEVIGKFVYKTVNIFSAATLGAISTFSYFMMIWLASVRIDKFKQRNALFDDRNNPENEPHYTDGTYYKIEADALLATLTADEREKLFDLAKDTRENLNFIWMPPKDKKLADIIDATKKGYDAEAEKKAKAAVRTTLVALLQRDAATLSQHKTSPLHTDARVIIDNWSHLLANIRKRPTYFEVKYEAFIEQNKQYINKTQRPQNIDGFIRSIISQKIHRDEAEVKCLLAEISVIEQAWKKSKGHVLDDLDNFTKFWLFVKEQADIIKQRPQHEDPNAHAHLLDAKLKILILDHHLTTNDLNHIRATYHQLHSRTELHDRNDKAYYKGQERGILLYERKRTLTKVWVFNVVRNMSIIAAPISFALFVAGFFVPAVAIAAFIPLFLVGTTSLIDEIYDVKFKSQKWRQSMKAMNEWKSQHSFLMKTSVLENGITVEKNIDVMDLIREKIKKRQEKPEILKEFSDEELKFIIHFTTNRRSADQTAFKVSTEWNYLQPEIQKLLAFYAKNASTDDEKTEFRNQFFAAARSYIKQLSAPLMTKEELSTNAVLRAFFLQDKIKHEIEEYRFFTGECDTTSFLESGLHYLEYQHNVLEQYEKRCWRRKVKFIQSSFSFGGIFIGVAGSMAMTTLLLAASISEYVNIGLSLKFLAHIAPVLDAFNILGLVTIGLAAIGSTIMVVYQLRQNHIKHKLTFNEHYGKMCTKIEPKQDDGTSRKEKLAPTLFRQWEAPQPEAQTGRLAADAHYGQNIAHNALARAKAFVAYNPFD